MRALWQSEAFRSLLFWSAIAAALFGWALVPPGLIQ